MAANTYRILVINPGSTSTKLGLYENEHCVYSKDIQHDLEELSRFNLVADQLDYRERDRTPGSAGPSITLHSLHAVACREAGYGPSLAGSML